MLSHQLAEPTPWNGATGVPYRFGETRWDDYLAAAAREGHERAGLAAAGSPPTGGLLADQWGPLSVIAGRLDVISSPFDWTFTLVRDRLPDQADAVWEVLRQLDDVAARVAIADHTRMREVFRVGQGRLQQGLYVRAREVLLQAADLDDVDFLLQLQLGKLALYGSNARESVVDLAEAERRLDLALQYTDSVRATLQRTAEVCRAEAQLHAGRIRYLQASEAHRVHDPNRAHERLASAEGLLTPNRSRDATYLRARIRCLLHNRMEALTDLAAAADGDFRAVQAAGQDDDFTALRSELGRLKQTLVQSPGPRTAAALRALEEVRSPMEQADRIEFSPEHRRLINDAGNALLRLRDAFFAGIVGYAEVMSQARTLASTAGSRIRAACSDRRHTVREQREACVARQREAVTGALAQRARARAVTTTLAATAFISLLAVGALHAGLWWWAGAGLPLVSAGACYVRGKQRRQAAEHHIAALGKRVRRAADEEQRLAKLVQETQS